MTSELEETVDALLHRLNSIETTGRNANRTASQHGAGEPVKTLRDEMAMAALPALASLIGEIIHDLDNNMFARDAYKIADAMLAARKDGVS